MIALPIYGRSTVSEYIICWVIYHYEINGFVNVSFLVNSLKLTNIP